MLERNFGDFYDLPATGSVRLAGGRRLRYAGQGRSPEYFLVSSSDSAGDFGGAESDYAVLFAPLATAQAIAGRPGAVNELVVRVRRGADVAAVERQLQQALRRSLPGSGTDIVRGGDENAYRVLHKDAEGDQKVYNVFALLLLAGAAFAAFNLISRIVEAQRREIGIGMALGVNGRTLAVRPMLLGVEIAVLGAVAGAGTGLLMSAWLRGALESLLPLPVLETGFLPEVYVRGALVGLMIPLLAAAFPVWRAVRMSPIDAIRIGFRSAHGGGAAPLIKRLPLPGGTFGQMPFRNVLRAPRRTLTTLFGLAVIIAVVVALLGMVDSFTNMIDSSQREMAGDSPQRMDVRLDGFYPTGSAPVRALGGAAAVGAAEPVLEVPAKVRAGAERFNIRLGLIPAKGALWEPTPVSGALRPGREGIMLAEPAAQDLGVGVGDTVRLTHQVRTGPAAFRTQTTRVRVAGVHASPFRTSAYMDRSQARLLGLAGATNVVQVTPAPAFSQDQVERALFSSAGVASVRSVTASTDLFRDRMDEFLGVLRVAELLTLLLAVLIAFNSTSINADERAREQATMTAFGVPLSTSLRVSIVESFVVGLLATLLGLALGLVVLRWVLGSVIPGTFPDLGLAASLSGSSLAAAVVVGVVAVTLAPLLVARRMARMDVPSTLRVVE